MFARVALISFAILCASCGGFSEVEETPAPKPVSPATVRLQELARVVDTFFKYETQVRLPFESFEKRRLEDLAVRAKSDMERKSHTCRQAPNPKECASAFVAALKHVTQFLDVVVASGDAVNEQWNVSIRHLIEVDRVARATFSTRLSRRQVQTFRDQMFRATVLCDANQPRVSPVEYMDTLSQCVAKRAEETLKWQQLRDVILKQKQKLEAEMTSSANQDFETPRTNPPKLYF